MKKENIILIPKLPNETSHFFDSMFGFCIEVMNSGDINITVKEVGFMDRYKNIIFKSSSFLTSDQKNDVIYKQKFDIYFHPECENKSQISYAYARLDCGEVLIAQNPDLLSLSET